MSENARKLVRDVGSVHVELLCAGFVVDNAKKHMKVANDLVVLEMDYYGGPISVGRPYLFALRAAMDVRRGFDGQDCLAFQQVFNFSVGDYTQHAKFSSVPHRHMLNCHEALGSFRALSDEEYATLRSQTSAATAHFLKMDGSIVHLPWGCLKVKVHSDKFRSREWVPGLTRKR
jgi:hypothetical protein